YVCVFRVLASDSPVTFLWEEILIDLNKRLAQPVVWLQTEGARHKNGKHGETYETEPRPAGSATPNAELPAIRTIASFRSRLGYTPERLHIYIAHPTEVGPL